MKKSIKPIVVISKCLGFDNCRYNGQTVQDAFVDKLQPHVEYQTICPEVEIGLGVPRDPVRIISAKEQLKLIQPATNLDVTDKMEKFTDKFLGSLKEVDGFILKYRSPSCGIKDVKVYPSGGKVRHSGKTRGFFGGAVAKKFPLLAVEDEGRLKNFRIREHFLTCLFTHARFAQAKKSAAMKEIVRFHSENKFLLMAYNQKELRILGRIVANPDKKPIRDVFDEYEQHLMQALGQPPRFTSNINVMMHSLGYFSKNLSAKEKAFFLDQLEKYRAEKLPLTALTSVMRSWIIRFDQDYLAPQTFFEPYPEPLFEITDSGKGRDL
jgi:uncharacterized protein YbgA (DUF1722 family)/uncharacterized protein YbbK (DUF523 family)